MDKTEKVTSNYVLALILILDSDSMVSMTFHVYM